MEPGWAVRDGHPRALAQQTEGRTEPIMSTSWKNAWARTAALTAAFALLAATLPPGIDIAREAPGNVLALVSGYFGLTPDRWGKDALRGRYPWMEPAP